MRDDDFFRFTCVLFLSHKDESFKAFIKFCKKVQNEQDLKIVSVRRDHGGEFENAFFKNIIDKKWHLPYFFLLKDT